MPRSLYKIGLCAALVAYGAFLSFLIGAVPGGSDNSGYFNEARLFSRHRIHTPLRELAGLPAKDALPYLYVPLGFKPSPDGSSGMVPTYPPGLPLMLVPMARIAGWRQAGDILLLLHSLAGIALTYALGRKLGLAEAWSLFGAALLAASPLYLFTSLQALSDVPATVWATAAVLAALMSRERTPWAFAAGASFGVAFLVRPSNFLVALPVAIALGFSPRRWIVAAVGGIPGVAAWMAINHAAYGGYLVSGYGAIQDEFHASLIPATLRHCARWMPLLFSPVVIAAPGILAFLRSRTRSAALLTAWAAAYIAFYSPYRWTHETWWFLRFLLPAAPALIVAALIVVSACFDGLRAAIRKSSAAALAGLLAISSLGAESIQIIYLSAWSIGRGERKYGRAADWLSANVPRDSVILLSQFSGAVYYFTDFTFLRADQIDSASAPRIRGALQAGRRPLYALLFPFEKDLIQRLPAKWTIVRTIDDVVVLRGDWPAK